jgi:exosortase
MLGLFVMWLGAFVLSYGIAAVKTTTFAWLLLLFMIPFPPPLLHAVIVFLQKTSADGTALLFPLVGIPFFREGFVFSLPGLTIQVAEECSGIRSSLALTISGLVMSYLWLQGLASRAVFMALIIPVAIAKNVLRIVALSWLAINVDPSFITGSTVHSNSGIPVFLLALCVLAGIGWIVRRIEAWGRR